MEHHSCDIAHDLIINDCAVFPFWIAGYQITIRQYTVLPYCFHQFCIKLWMSRCQLYKHTFNLQYSIWAEVCTDLNYDMIFVPVIIWNSGPYFKWGCLSLNPRITILWLQNLIKYYNYIFQNVMFPLLLYIMLLLLLCFKNYIFLWWVQYDHIRYKTSPCEMCAEGSQIRAQSVTLSF